jgi:hypothetical protein
MGPNVAQSVLVNYETVFTDKKEFLRDIEQNWISKENPDIIKEAVEKTLKDLDSLISPSKENKFRDGIRYVTELQNGVIQTFVVGTCYYDKNKGRCTKQVTVEHHRKVEKNDLPLKIKIKIDPEVEKEFKDFCVSEDLMEPVGVGFRF